MMALPRPLYFDHQATTPVAPEVLARMLPYFTERPGNPGSKGHRFGLEAAAAVNHARDQIAQALHTQPEAIIFTSGATEANNLVIKGVAEAYLNKGRHLITVVTEHAAVLGPCDYLAKYGFEITYLPVQPDGRLDLEQFTQALRPDTVLVSVMLANNEIGVLQPVSEIAQICHDHGVLCHTDAAQALGKIPIDLEQLGVDFLSFSGHKLYGPKGIGGLYLRPKQPRLKLAPQLHGGGQEQNLRAGTLPTPLIVGLGAAVEFAVSQIPTETTRLIQLRERLWQGLAALGPVIRNGHPTQTLPGCLSVTFPGRDGIKLHRDIAADLALSSGSACSAGAPSHVLRALGYPEADCRATLRLGLGRDTTLTDIERALEVIAQALANQIPNYPLPLTH